MFKSRYLIYNFRKSDFWKTDAEAKIQTQVIY